MVFILVAPQHQDDIATTITLAWGHQLSKWLQAHDPNMKLFSFLGKDAVRDKVVNCLTAHQGAAGVFVFLDHGSRTSFLGSDGYPILDMANVALLAHKFVYAVACYSAAHLGHAAVRQGAAGFLGYNDTVQLKPGADQLFYDCLVLAGLKGLLQQETASRLRMRVIERIQYWMEQIAKMKMPPEKKWAVVLPTIAILAHNRDYLIHLGDADWSWPDLSRSHGATFAGM